MSQPILKLIILCLLLASCSSLKHDQRALGKIHYRNPQLLEGYCAERFPVKIHDSIIEKYLPGRIDTFPGETIVVNCDSAIKVQTKYVKVPCPPSVKRIDTIYKQVNRIVENTAMIAVQSRRADEAERKLLLSEDHNKQLKHRLLMCYSILGVIICLIILSITRKLYLR